MIFDMKKVYYCIVAIIILSACSDGGKANDVQEEENPLFKGNPPVYISEIYLANADLKDEFGNNPAWVEFFNPADTLFNLKGFTLSDNISSTTGSTLNGAVFWTFGDVEILPHSYTIVFFSGRNKPNLTPATDSSDLIKNAVGAWSWADGEGDPKGNSTAKFNFSKTTGLNGTLNSADNFGILNYSSAVIMLKLSGWDNSNILNISNANQILLRGNLAKNSKLEIRLAQNGVEEWKAWATNIKGSGIENDLYVIDLPSNTLPNSFPNLADIYGLRFANPQNVFGEIKFSFNSIVAQKSAVS
ncbi:hypothetical protein AGMMS49938_18000 [Fibrobacterales bacterium]|nr:hypothetical protein AGMMS49938_18000 [Fibrobacterales bacterium]